MSRNLSTENKGFGGAITTVGDLKRAFEGIDDNEQVYMAENSNLFNLFEIVEIVKVLKKTGNKTEDPSHIVLIAA